MKQEVKQLILDLRDFRKLSSDWNILKIVSNNAANYLEQLISLDTSKTQNNTGMLPDLKKHWNAARKWFMAHKNSVVYNPKQGEMTFDEMCLVIDEEAASKYSWLVSEYYNEHGYCIVLSDSGLSQSVPFYDEFYFLAKVQLADTFVHIDWHNRNVFIDGKKLTFDDVCALYPRIYYFIGNC